MEEDKLIGYEYAAANSKLSRFIEEQYRLLTDVRIQVSELKVENERLRKSLSENKTWQAIGAYAEAKEEIARLTAENERLRKAGDVTIAAYCMGDWDTERWKEYPVVRQWLAAKEGKPLTKHEDDIRRGLRTK